MYMGNDSVEQGTLEVTNLREPTCKQIGMKLRRPTQNNLISLPPDRTCDSFLRGAETSLISVHGDSYIVWCFDCHLAQTITFEDDVL